MLEASSSRDLSFPEEPTPFYFLELYGETNPQVDPDYAQVLATKGGSSAGPIYEYFWTLGLYDPPQPPQASKSSSPSRKLLHVRPTASAPSSGWGKFAADSSAQVYVLFPRSSGWRVHELAASIKYLAPVSMQKSFVQEMDKDIAALQPLLGVAGTAASAVGAVGAGPAASATGHVLDAMAKMKVGSVPQAPGFEWSVKKFTTWAHGPSDTDSPTKGWRWGTRRWHRMEYPAIYVRNACRQDRRLPASRACCGSAGPVQLGPGRRDDRRTCCKHMSPRRQATVRPRLLLRTLLCLVGTTAVVPRNGPDR